MCGISAVFLKRDGNAARMTRSMNALIHHRGPDDEGYVFIGSFGKPCFRGGADTPSLMEDCPIEYRPDNSMPDPVCRIGLGHRRLAIQDISARGHQPMARSRGRFLVVYNGEIYNFLELRKELSAMGAVFESGSDTEVLLEAYAQWGSACLTRFNGMFAFVLLDMVERKVFVARDRFGIKPLYCWLLPQGGVAFASEIKQFTVLPGWSARLHEQMAYDYLVYGLADHTSDTLFYGVVQIPGGTFIECRWDELTDNDPVSLLQAWYELPPYRPQRGGNFGDAAREFAMHFRRSINFRLRSDQPVGTALSGGMDSSSIVCMANVLLQERESNARFHSFSACVRDPELDEREYMEAVIEATGAIPHFVYPEVGALFDSLDEIIWHQDEPFLSTSIFAEWSVFDLVRQSSVKVTLDGHGADELLAGYHPAFGVLLADALRAGRPDAALTQARRIHAMHDYSYFRLAQWTADCLLPETVRQRMRRWSGRMHSCPDWLNPSVWLSAVRDDPRTRLDLNERSLPAYMRTQMLKTSLPVQLHWADRDSMRNSIESRLPFLDYQLVEFVLSCPAEFISSGGITKRILREALSDILPPKITQRKSKFGFVTPERHWMFTAARSSFRQEVTDLIETSGGWITPKALRVFDQMAEGRIPFSFQIWRWICLGKWIKRFSVQMGS